jgi:hypothetical protein
MLSSFPAKILGPPHVDAAPPPTLRLALGSGVVVVVVVVIFVVVVVIVEHALKTILVDVGLHRHRVLICTTVSTQSRPVFVLVVPCVSTQSALGRRGCSRGDPHLCLLCFVLVRLSRGR